MKKKLKTRSSTYYRKKCVIWAKLEARKRDNDTCQYCGRSKSQGYAIHGSHILPEGAYPLVSAEPYNIIALCSTHHLSGANPRMGNKEPSWHSHPLFFTDWFNKKWPDRYKELQDMDKEANRHIVNWEKRYEEIKSLIKKYGR